MGWAFPLQENVVMDFLEDNLDTERVWVGSWYPSDPTLPPSEITGFDVVVLVTNNGHSTVDETRWGTVEIEVEADSRADARDCAAEISSLLNDLAGKTVRGVLVDDVVENEGFRAVDNPDNQKRTYGMIYTLAFRKQLLVEGD